MPSDTDPASSGFPYSVAKRLRDLAAFEEAGIRLESRPSNLHDKVDEVLAEVRALKLELHLLREAIQPTESPLITGRDAMREYRALTTPRT
ncbi:hypothetical protein [Piscinibacter defluvii]|uniref:hypothetical protein n=1 Tax=Piscinibacter defluvii TaxID=1796922 RepID=UPI000FDEF440|nr:hypothetical protein [Piscinibacter defluvii]